MTRYDAISKRIAVRPALKLDDDAAAVTGVKHLHPRPMSKESVAFQRGKPDLVSWQTHFSFFWMAHPRTFSFQGKKQQHLFRPPALIHFRAAVSAHGRPNKTGHSLVFFFLPIFIFLRASSDNAIMAIHCRCAKWLKLGSSWPKKLETSFFFGFSTTPKSSLTGGGILTGRRRKWRVLWSPNTREWRHAARRFTSLNGIFQIFISLLSKEIEKEESL